PRTKIFSPDESTKCGTECECSFGQKSGYLRMRAELDRDRVAYAARISEGANPAETRHSCQPKVVRALLLDRKYSLRIGPTAFCGASLPPARLWRTTRCDPSVSGSAHHSNRPTVFLGPDCDHAS